MLLGLFVSSACVSCRYALGHLLTVIEQFEEERVRGQCQNLLRVARRLLGKIGEYVKGCGGVLWVGMDIIKSQVSTNKRVIQRDLCLYC